MVVSNALRQGLRAVVPQPVRFGLRRVAYWGGALSCPLCGASVRTFIAHGGGPEVLERRRVVGGMLRPADACPVCHGADRTRLMMLYLDQVMKVGRTPLRLLHVAPDPGLHRWLGTRDKLDYTAADLDLERYRHIPGIVRADLTELPFDNDGFDVVVCSHVLEHVPDDRKAMSEIRRVLRPGGRALLMVPLAQDGLPTDEDLAVTDARDREARFGQWDHVRLYSPEDFVRRLVDAGFEVERFNGLEQPTDRGRDLRLNPLETLIVALRPHA